MKRIGKVFQAIAVVLAVAGGGLCAQAALTGGGVAGNPYLIGSYADLKEFAQAVNGNHAATTETKLKGDSTSQHERTEP